MHTYTLTCSHCKTNKEPTEFYQREDRIGAYRWCKRCMDKQGRSPDYPAIEDRGYGVINQNYEWQIS